MRNRQVVTYRVTCAQCGKVFEAHSPAARTCSPRCRTALFRDVRNGNGKTWHSVDAAHGQKAMDIKHVSENAYDAICAVLGAFGAVAACYAIDAAYEFAEECAKAIEENRL